MPRKKRAARENNETSINNGDASSSQHTARPKSAINSFKDSKPTNTSDEDNYVYVRRESVTGHRRRRSRDRKAPNRTGRNETVFPPGLANKKILDDLDYVWHEDRDGNTILSQPLNQDVINMIMRLSSKISESEARAIYDQNHHARYFSANSHFPYQLSNMYYQAPAPSHYINYNSAPPSYPYFATGSGYPYYGSAVHRHHEPAGRYYDPPPAPPEPTGQHHPRVQTEFTYVDIGQADRDYAYESKSSGSSLPSPSRERKLRFEPPPSPQYVFTRASPSEDASESERSIRPTPAVNDAKHEKPPRIQYLAQIYESNLRDGQPDIYNPTVITQNSPIETTQLYSQSRTTEQIQEQAFNPDLPVFQVEKLYAAPSGSRGRRNRRGAARPARSWKRNARHRRHDADEEAPVEVEREAGTILKIYSPVIIQVIERVAGSYPGLIIDGDSLIVPEPFCAFLTFRDKLLEDDSATEAMTDGQDDESVKVNGDSVKGDKSAPSNTKAEEEPVLSDIRLLYSYLDQEYLQPVLLEKSRWEQRATCTFEWLWLLFAPGTLVYEAKTVETTMMRAYRVVSFYLDGLFQYDDHRPTVHRKRLEHMTGPTQEQPLERISINVTYRRHDGRQWVDKSFTFSISPFRGEKPIRELEIYPARFFGGSNETIRERLIRRGRRYQSLATRGQVDYHGDILSGVRRRLDGRVIVDSETYHYEPHLISEHNASRKQEVALDSRNFKTAMPQNWDNLTHVNGFSPVLDRLQRDNEEESGLSTPIQATGKMGALNQVRDRAKPVDLSNVYELSEDDYMICAPDIQAYALKERNWVVLAVDCVSDCVYEEGMIDNLQISPEANRLVQALSHNHKIVSDQANAENGHEVRRPWSSDFVSNKGGGQIILLHGKPGVGKTTTAECIAELTKRPLLTVTCGDLGTDAMSVERELARWLRLGTLWNAVLLFDEADVFLESRAHGDIDRNSLVSVFLRALEYYQGLMFLTTNRIGSFDEAIISRIHVVLHLPNLSNTDRARIWDSSFRKLAKERLDITVDYTLVNYAHHDVAVHKLNWNGREIRNAFNTMIALAEWDAHRDGRYTKDGKFEVRREHLEEVVKMSGNFKGYLKSLRQMEHEQYMKSLGLRDDKFKAIEQP